MVNTFPQLQPSILPSPSFLSALVLSFVEKPYSYQVPHTNLSLIVNHHLHRCMNEGISTQHQYPSISPQLLLSSHPHTLLPSPFIHIPYCPLLLTSSYSNKESVLEAAKRPQGSVATDPSPRSTSTSPAGWGRDLPVWHGEEVGRV